MLTITSDFHSVCVFPAEHGPGYDALERYPALLKEMKGLSATQKDAPEGLTSDWVQIGE